MKEDLLKIINNYGAMPQLKYLQSEVFELNEAIINFENEIIHCDSIADEGYIKSMKNHIVEELSDVMVMLGQFINYYGIKNKDIKKFIDYKIKRQLRRIEDEKTIN